MFSYYLEKYFSIILVNILKFNFLKLHIRFQTGLPQQALPIRMQHKYVFHFSVTSTYLSFYRLQRRQTGKKTQPTCASVPVEAEDPGVQGPLSLGTCLSEWSDLSACTPWGRRQRSGVIWSNTVSICDPFRDKPDWTVNEWTLQFCWKGCRADVSSSFIVKTCSYKSMYVDIRKRGCVPFKRPKTTKMWI